MRHIAFKLGRGRAAQTLAVADQNAAPVVRVGLTDQLINVAAGLLHRALMQIEFSGNVVAALAEFFEDRKLNTVLAPLQYF